MKIRKEPTLRLRALKGFRTLAMVIGHNLLRTTIAFASVVFSVSASVKQSSWKSLFSVRQLSAPPVSRADVNCHAALSHSGKT